MKRFLPYFLITALIITSFYLVTTTFGGYREEFKSPLDISNPKIRNDSMGEGHFGAKRKNGRKHTGVDILAPVGTPVKSAVSGWAIARFDEDGYGRYVKIYHGGGLTTLYAHLADTTIIWQRPVKRGEVIGRTGNTGNARFKAVRPHLHFEVRKSGVPQDPMKGYIR
ncbi:MAG: M23 family metallopeptidase [Candidatus Omnitrophica bacterium]|nr:M23 family metallopeptidase [Candidatus Omnitrophota bacterium]